MRKLFTRFSQNAVSGGEVCPGLRRRVFHLGGLLLSFLFLGTAAFGQRIGKLEQGANGPGNNPYTPVEWTSGSLVGNKAHFVEGMTIPYRLEALDLEPSQTYCVTIGITAKTGGRHIIDFLTSYDNSSNHDLFGHAPEFVDPLIGTALEGTGVLPATVEFPVPDVINSPVSGQPATAFTSLPVEQRQLTIFGGVVETLNFAGPTDLAADEAELVLEVCFRANPESRQVVLAWGEHIAQSKTWGEEKGASGFNGLVRTRIIDCTGLSGCGQVVLPLQPSAIASSEGCGISGPTFSCPGQRIVLTLLTDEKKPRLFWSILENNTGAVIEGPPTRQSVTIWVGPNTGSFTAQVRRDRGLTCSVEIQVVDLPEGALAPADQLICLGEDLEPWTVRGAAGEELLTGGAWEKEFRLLDSEGQSVVTAPTAEELMALFPGEPGSYSVTLLAWAAGYPDCSASYGPVTFTVWEGPAAAFGAAATCDGEEVQFSNQSRAGTSDKLTYLWAFEDGITSAEENPIHVFSAPGIHEVELTVTDENGCSDTFIDQVIIFEKPKALFAAAPVCEGQTVQFTNKSTGAEGAQLSFLWSFGDGNTSAEVSPAHLYSTPGIYTVVLTATDENGCSDDFTAEVEVFENPQALFTALSACGDLSVQFTSQSGGGQGALQFQWSFGDGQTSTEAEPLQVYAAPGFYTVTLTVTDEKGCSDTYFSEIGLFEQPQALFTAEPVCDGEEIYFSNQSVEGSSPELRYAWSFGDGTTSNAAEPRHSYATPGKYTVTLTVTDGNGCSATYSDAAQVWKRPQANFTATTVCEGEPMAFQNTSQAGDHADLAFFWNFGDGRTSTLRNPSHVFAGSGIFRVSLIITDRNGCSHSIVREVTVRQKPVAGFSAETVCEGQPTRLVNLSRPGGSGNLSYLWVFENGTTSRAANPSHTFRAPGIHSVQLTVTDAEGCTDTYVGEAEVLAAPKAAFQAEDACEGESVVFVPAPVAGSGAVVLFEWQFGDGRGSLVEAPEHIYSKPGKYLATLTVTDVNGCSDTFEKEVEVYKKPQAFFSAENACQGQAVTFSNQSVPGSGQQLLYSWDFGDGQTSNEKNPAHQYERSGSFQVSLLVTDENGCSHEWRRPVVLFEPVVVEAGGDAEICEGSSIRLNGAISGGVQTGTWSDGGIGGSFEPSARALGTTYRPPSGYAGTVNLRLTSDTPAGPCAAGADGLTLNVVATPEARFETSDACLGEAVHFDVLNGGDNLTYQWQFGDGKTSAEANPSHSYTSAGVYSVTLTVTNSKGCSDEFSRQVSIWELPVAAFSASPVCDGQEVIFVNKTQSPNTGDIKYLWSFGDGTTSSDANPRHAYAGPGNYTVTLRVENGVLCAGEVSHTVEVYTLPEVSFDYSWECGSSEVAFFNKTNGGLEYQWSFGNNAGSSQANPTFRFPGPGTYQVMLTATSDKGCSSSFSRQVEVPASPQADFGFATECGNYEVRFTDQSNAGSAVLETHIWNFGDGGTSTGNSPLHQFQKPGTYTVSLTVTDANGCSSVRRQEVIVKAPPIVDFEAPAVCGGEAVSFTNLSAAGSAPLTTFEWHFGDGQTSAERDPVHIYGAHGKYRVELIVTDANGCQTAFQREVAVWEGPLPDFTIDRGCAGQAVGFTNKTVTGAASVAEWLWDFGDGTQSKLKNPTHLYAAAGSHTVTLTVTDANGCRRAFSRSIVVHELPVAAFATAPVCDGQGVTFRNQSRAGSRPIASYLWEFGDGQTSAAQHPSHQYGEPGKYRVRLTVADTGGCPHTMEKEVEVFAIPQADFSATVDCARQEAAFKGRVETNGGAINTYHWDFGDGQSSTTADPIHGYQLPGRYTVVLTIRDANGCASLKEKEVIIPEAPQAAFMVKDVCTSSGSAILAIDNQSQPSSTGGGAMNYLWRVLNKDGREIANSQAQDPAFTLPLGHYTVELTVTDNSSCQTEISAPVQIVNEPSIAIETANEQVCEGDNTTLTATLGGGIGCRAVQWQTSRSPSGPWTIITNADEETYTIPATLAAGFYYFRGQYSCDGENCSTATSNVVRIEVGAGEARLACNDLVRLVLRSDCELAISPDEVAEGTFGFCFPYRPQDFEVIVYDGIYPNGSPDNRVEKWGQFSYQLKLGAEALAAGAQFEPCWGEVYVDDVTPPAVTCPADVIGLIQTPRNGNDFEYRPAASPQEAGSGEQFHRLICTEVGAVYNIRQSWENEDYPYFTGAPLAEDACGDVTLLKVEDVLEDVPCGSIIFGDGSLVTSRLQRTFTYADERGNTNFCTQEIFFFRPEILLPECVVSFDLCEYGGDEQLDPEQTGTAPYYFTGTGQRLFLNAFVCGIRSAYADQRFPGPQGCGFRLVRTWTLLVDCGNYPGFPGGLTALENDPCMTNATINGNKLTFEQQLVVEDQQAPRVFCPSGGISAFPTGPFNCTAVLNPPPPVVEGECQDWDWTFEVYGYVTDPLTLLKEYKLIGKARDGLLVGVPVGEYDLVYIVTDACGQVGRSDECPIRVEDRINPVMVCDNSLSVSIGGGGSNARGIAVLTAGDADEGSRDNCGSVELAVRRDIDPGCVAAYADLILGLTWPEDFERKPEPATGQEYYVSNGDTLIVRLADGTLSSWWAGAVYFICCDIDGLPPVVTLRATDLAGNHGYCSLPVLIEDKIPPRGTVRDEVISCAGLDFDPSDAQQVAGRFGAPEEVVEVLDNCGATISEEIIWTPLGCGRGTIERVFTLTDNSGLSSVCTQTITVEEVNAYEVILPPDLSGEACGEAPVADLSYQVAGCDLLAISRDTVPFDQPGESCVELLVEYEVINWCEFDEGSNLAPTQIPRDVDGDGQLEEATWVVVGFDEVSGQTITRIYGATAGGDREATPRLILREGDAGYTPGYFKYSQFIRLIDNQPPNLEVLTTDLTFCSYPEDGFQCSGPMEMILKAQDDCPGGVAFIENVRILLNGDPARSQTPAGGLFGVTRDGVRYIVSGDLPIGSHRLVVRAFDGCGNSRDIGVDFEIRDCQAPAPICREVITADLMPVDVDNDGRVDGGMVTLDPTAFIASEIDDCSTFPDEPVHGVKYFLSRREPRDLGDLTDRTITFDCLDKENGVVEVYLIALDAAGNFDYCTVSVVVRSGLSPDPCVPPLLNDGEIGGLIMTEEDKPVEGVMVRVSGQMNTSVFTEADGYYYINNLQEGYDFTVFPMLDEDYVNGVTTYDMVVITKHILGEEPLRSPYKMIAADANHSNTITTFDLIQFRKLILTVSSDLENNTSWRFVEARHRFPNPEDPWRQYFPEVVNINDLRGFWDGTDFVAIKVGDVNATARTSRLVEPEIRSTSGVMTITAGDRVLRPGEEVVLTLRTENLEDVLGCQFTLQFDAGALELADVLYGELRAANLGIFAKEGTVTASWNRMQPSSGTSSSPASELFSLVFRATAAGQLSDVVRITSRRTPAEAYDLQGQILGINLNFQSAMMTALPFEVFQNFPNPFQEQTTIDFYLPEANDVNLVVQDAHGRMLLQRQGRFGQGYQQFLLNASDLPASGVLFYTVRTECEQGTRKMILLK